MSEADHELDTAWRAASREEPPAALDDAIRAAARREVGAGPRRARDARVWLPLAAAATVGVIAVGIVEMTPPERVSPSVVGDIRSAPMPSKPDTDMPASPALSAGPDASPNADVGAADASRTDKLVSAQRGVVVARKEALARQPTEEQAAASDKKRKSEIAAAPMTAPTSPPAVASLRERAQRQQPETSEPENAAPPAVPPAAPSRSEPFPAASSPRDNAVAAAPPPMQAHAPASAGAAGAVGSSAELQRTEKRMALAKSAAGESDRAKDAASRAPDEWIKLIRRLVAEGKTQEAAKELAAFRAAYKDRADTLLPNDLREFKR